MPNSDWLRLKDLFNQINSLIEQEYMIFDDNNDYISGSMFVIWEEKQTIYLNNHIIVDGEDLNDETYPWNFDRYAKHLNLDDWTIHKPIKTSKLTNYISI